MALKNTDEVDSIGIETETGQVLLSVIDEEQWSDQESYIQLLQEKLNNYLGFVESGELLQAYPDAKGRGIGFEVYTKFPFPEQAMEFLTYVSAKLIGAGYTFKGLQWVSGDEEADEWEQVI